MKVKVTSNQVYTPVNVSIELSTREEYDLFRYLMSSSYSVPEHIFCSPSSDLSVKLSAMMSKIFLAIDNECSTSV